MAAGDATGYAPAIGNIVQLRRGDARAVRPGVRPVDVTAASTKVVSFDRAELRLILSLYGRQVAAGEWKDYAIDFSGDRAEFSVMRRTSEFPLYTIRKVPALARKQGAFSVVSVTGFILRRGHDLSKVLAVLEPKLRPA